MSSADASAVLHPRRRASPGRFVRGLFRLQARGTEHLPRRRRLRARREPPSRTSTRGRSGCRSGRGGAALHGEVGALQSAARARPRRRRRVPRAARRGRPRGDRDRGRARAGRRGRRDVPGGHAAQKGLRKKFEARPRTGAARIALDAGVPLVPAAIKGTDRLARLGQLRVAYGAPIPLDDLPDGDRARPRGRDRPADGGDRRGCDADAVSGRCSRSTATRSRTAPTTRCRSRSARQPRASSASRTCSSGSGRPSSRARCSSAGTRSTCRPTGTRRSPATSPAASSTTSIARAARPAAGARRGVRLRRREGAPATRRTTSSPRPRRRGGRGGRSLVATSDRDAFQLASERSTILQPVRGVSRARADRPGRGARALRRRAGAGARLHRAARRPVGQDPGRARRRPEDGGRPAPAVRLARGGARGRAASRRRREDLRLYRRIATLDASAPLPPLDDQPRLGGGVRSRARMGARPARRRLGLEAPSSS